MILAKILLSLLFVSLFSVVAEAAPASLSLDSHSVILVEHTTGRVLYSRNERERISPANLTKMVTAMVALDFLDVDDIIVVGSEIRNMPAGFTTNAVSEGETTVRELLHALIVRSSGEAARVLAINTLRQRDGRFNITLDQANQGFSAIMNERARSLGTTGTSFNNTFGQHFENHFSTAYDLAIITRAFMENPILAEIAATREHGNWTNTNQMLPDAPHGHPYIIGAKAGSNTASGHMLAAAAYDDGLQLVAVVVGGTDAHRWQDTRRLMDFGFNNFRFREIAVEGDLIQTVQIENPRLGDKNTLEIVLGAGSTPLLSRAEYAALTHTITFDPLIYVESEEGTSLRAPIEEGMAVGTVSYVADGRVIFESPVLAARLVEERTFDSDMDYHLAAFFGSVFTRRALPYWVGIIGVLIGVIGIISAIRANRITRNSGRYRF
ncbi:MAG: hypothetical protein FWF78_05955 [Defluviitaleaceae bacterium]|nr:hypothetical protein [Defluviitaleaceae bacterium]